MFKSLKMSTDNVPMANDFQNFVPNMTSLYHYVYMNIGSVPDMTSLYHYISI